MGGWVKKNWDKNVRDQNLVWTQIAGGHKNWDKHFDDKHFGTTTLGVKDFWDNNFRGSNMLVVKVFGWSKKIFDKHFGGSKIILTTILGD